MADAQTDTQPGSLPPYDPGIFTVPPASGTLPPQYIQPDVTVGTQQQVQVPPPKPPVPQQQVAVPPPKPPPPQQTPAQTQQQPEQAQPASGTTGGQQLDGQQYTPPGWRQQQPAQQQRPPQINSPATDIGGREFPARTFDYPVGLEGNILVRETAGGPGADTAISKAGAIGRYQVEPYTANHYFPQYSTDQWKSLLLDPKINQYVGRTIMQDLWNKYKGDQTLVMIGYNAGDEMVDKYVAAGRDPMVLPRETRKYIYGIDEAGSTDAYQGVAEANKQLQDLYTREAATIQKEMDNLTPGSPEQRALADQLLRKQMQLMDKYEEMIANPPTQKPLDMARNFGSIATLIGIFGGRFAHAPLTASLNAAGAAMQAMNQNNATQYKQAFETWKSQAEMTQNLMSMESNTYRGILDDERLSLEEKMTAIKMQADVFQNQALAKQAEIGGHEKMIEYVDKHQEATDKHAQVMAQIDEINARTKAMQTSDRGLKGMAYQAWFNWFLSTYKREPTGDEINDEIMRLEQHTPGVKTITPKEQQENAAITRAKQRYGTPPVNWQQVIDKQTAGQDVTDDDTKGWSDDWKLLLGAMGKESAERKQSDIDAINDYNLSKKSLNEAVAPAGTATTVPPPAAQQKPAPIPTPARLMNTPDGTPFSNTQDGWVYEKHGAQMIPTHPIPQNQT